MSIQDYWDGLMGLHHTCSGDEADLKSQNTPEPEPLPKHPLGTGCSPAAAPATPGAALALATATVRPTLAGTPAALAGIIAAAPEVHAAHAPSLAAGLAGVVAGAAGRVHRLHLVRLLLAGLHVEGDGVPGLRRAAVHHPGAVHEDVVAVGAGDEAKALLRVEGLAGALHAAGSLEALAPRPGHPGPPGHVASLHLSLLDIGRGATIEILV